jgi:hypothetical protein
VAPSLSLDARTLLSPDALPCPHPDSRKWATIRVQAPGERAMDLCATCKLVLERLVEGWAQGSTRVPDIFRAFATLGYAREDAGRFLADLQRNAAEREIAGVAERP